MFNQSLMAKIYTKVQQYNLKIIAIVKKNKKIKKAATKIQLLKPIYTHVQKLKSIFASSARKTAATYKNVRVHFIYD